jgi:hypothetical protein
MMLPVSRSFAAPPPVVPSAAPVKLTAKALPKPATKPTPQPAAASVSRREAPKRRLLSTHVNVWFNSPDKVQMYYEDAKYGNVWKAFGQWGSTWPGINERDLNPSETSPNGGTRFMVENKTTGQSFIVDKSNATFTALPDGRTRIAIEDRPGSKTPGSDIVLLLEPKFVTVKPTQTTRGLLQDVQLKADLRIIENWPSHKPSVRQQSLDDVFGYLTSERFTRGWNPMTKDLLHRMKPLFNQMQKSMPESAFARLGAVLRALCKDKEKFFVQTHKYSMAAQHADAATRPRLQYNPSNLKDVKGAYLDHTLAHELAHFAYESPVTASTTAALLGKPTLRQLVSETARGAKLTDQIALDLVRTGISEAIANDTANRTGSLASAGRERQGKAYFALPAMFVKAFLDQMPTGALAYQRTLPGLFWWATDKSDKTWRYEAALTKTFQQKIGKEMHVTRTGDPDRVALIIKKNDSWMNVFMKLGKMYQSAIAGSRP